jgi:phosphoglycerate dehydrogenase-like enzyme
VACPCFQTGVWDRKKYKGSELAGKVVGVVGLGNIGKEVCALRPHRLPVG